MKTTKKGFTLIELIVVIAIIGVLAAILIPAMMGYIRKSKITAANEAAITIMKAANTALGSLEEENISFSGTMQIDHASMERYTDPGDNPAADKDSLLTYMNVYSDDVNKTPFSLCIHNGVCVAVGTGKSNFYGCVPSIYTTRNYNDYDPSSVEDALADAVNEFDIERPGILDMTKVTSRDVLGRNHNQANAGNNGGDG